MQAGYLAALNDEEITSLRDELGLLTVRTQQLLSRLSAAEAPPWGDAVEALNDLKTARGKEDKGAALAELERILRTGAHAAQSQEATWDELRAVIADKTRTAAAEWKRLADVGALIETDKALAFVTALLQAARDVVADPETYRRLNARILQLLPPSPESSG